MRILFMGTGEIGIPSLETLIQSREHCVVGVVTQPDKLVGRKQVLTASAIKELAIRSGIPVQQPERIRQAEAVDNLRALNPEVIVVMAYGQILPEAILHLPSLACLNLHASLLPKFRGASPIQSALLAGETVTGITLMYMDVGLDTGDIMLQRELPILPGETAGNLHDRLGRLAPNVLLEGLNFLGAGSAPRIPQDPAAASVCRKLDRESGRLPWSRDAVWLERLVRAMNPWPGAFCLLPDGRKLKIHRAKTVEGVGNAGTVLPGGPGLMVVAAGSGALSLEEVQLEGRTRMTAAEFLRGQAQAWGGDLSFPA